MYFVANFSMIHTFCAEFSIYRIVFAALNNVTEPNLLSHLE